MIWQDLVSPQMLDRLRPAWMGVEAAIVAIGVVFWIGDGIGVDSFSPETWGHFATALPARFWAAWQIIAGALIFTGLARPVTARRVAVGAAAQAVQFGLIGYSAIWTGGQFVIGVWPSVFLVPFHLILFVEAARYARN